MTASITATIDPATLREKLHSATPPRMIDVRTPGEFETAHIVGAHNVPLDLLRDHCAELARHFDQHVVLVCRSGQRSAQAATALRDVGVADVHTLGGGIVAWQANGFDVNRGVPRWELERQVRLVAGTIVLSSILGSLAAPKLKWLAGGVGAGLAGAALTNTCAMGAALSRLPYNRGGACDLPTVAARLS